MKYQYIITAAALANLGQCQPNRIEDTASPSNDLNCYNTKTTLALFSLGHGKPLYQRIAWDTASPTGTKAQPVVQRLTISDFFAQRRPLLDQDSTSPCIRKITLDTAGPTGLRTPPVLKRFGLVTLFGKRRPTRVYDAASPCIE